MARVSPWSTAERNDHLCDVDDDTLNTARYD
jgi:hypothetical protein